MGMVRGEGVVLEIVP